jgi:hypothetical protein
MKRERICDVARNFSDAVAAQAGYVNKKGQFSLGGLQDSSKVDNGEEVRPFIGPASQPGPAFLASVYGPVEGIRNIRDLEHMAARILDWGMSTDLWDAGMLGDTGEKAGLFRWDTRTRCLFRCWRCEGK